MLSKNHQIVVQGIAFARTLTIEMVATRAAGLTNDQELFAWYTRTKNNEKQH